MGQSHGLNVPVIISQTFDDDDGDRRWHWIVVLTSAPTDKE
jgi:hypothetical protein